mmetsp:Transcript_25927/g.22974  ORF Transcript_25927/g.22974 Transcript_25927/m.22974 type:complete len:87 (+) Transcript_25927:654-914(+)
MELKKCDKCVKVFRPSGYMLMVNISNCFTYQNHHIKQEENYIPKEMMDHVKKTIRRVSEILKGINFINSHEQSDFFTSENIAILCS